jgi:ATP-dependent Clp protease ATP-binding subunit ClpA
MNEQNQISESAFDAAVKISDRNFTIREMEEIIQTAIDEATKEKDAKIVQLEAELDGYAFQLTPAMVHERNEQLNAQLEKACAEKVGDVLSYVKDQAKQFRQCAGHHAEHNRGAEAVAIRAAEILDRIAALSQLNNLEDK